MKIVQMVRFVTAVAQSYIGPVGQLVIDLGSKAIRIQDGATLGGFSTMIANNNLSDLSDTAAARNNLGLGSAATHAAGDFDAAGSAATALAAAEAYTDIETANRITDVNAEETARIAADTTLQNNINTEAANRTAGDIAAIATATGTALQKAQNLNDLANKPAARTNLDVYSEAQVDAQSFTNQASVVVPNTGANTAICAHNGSGGGMVIVRGFDGGSGELFVDIVPYYQFGGFSGGGPSTYISTDTSGHFGTRTYGAGATAALYLSRVGGPANMDINCRYVPL